VEYEIGVRPADDFVFDPVSGPKNPPDQIGLNAALKARLEAALGVLRAAAGGTTLQEIKDPPIAVQTQSNVSGVFSPDKYSSLPLLMSAVRSAEVATSGSTPQASNFNRRLFLVPNAHVSRLILPGVTRDGAEMDGYRVSGIDLFVNGQRKFLPIKPTCTVVLALGCIESTRLALESFPTAPDLNGDQIMGRNLMAHLRFDFRFQLNRRDFAAWVQTEKGKSLMAELQIASFHLQGDTRDGRFHLQVYARK